MEAPIGKLMLLDKRVPLEFMDARNTQCVPRN